MSSLAPAPVHRRGRTRKPAVERKPSGRLKWGRQFEVRTAAEERHGWDLRAVYVIGPHNVVATKVGIAKGVRARLSELQVGNWIKLTIWDWWWCTKPSDAALVEAEVMRRLQPEHLRGEWFEVRHDMMIAAVHLAAQAVGIRLITPAEMRQIVRLESAPA